MEIHLVADTNLFFECTALEQLPWAELDYEPIVILLTKPVLDEIDKHKKGSGRTRERALAIFGRVRDMLKSGTVEVEIKGSSPRVVLRRAPNAKPAQTLSDDLDYSKTDERLIGITASLSEAADGFLVKLFTDDTGPASTADGLGVPYVMIPENWRRPPAETPEQKRLKESEKELATYRSQEPKIVIDRCEEADENDTIEVERIIAQPLTKDEIEALLERLRKKYPLVTSFEPPEPSTRTAVSGEVTRIEYSPPAGADIERYQNEQYPQWLEHCRAVLMTVHEGRDVIEPQIILTWPIRNDGTRPAQQARVEFEARGPLNILRTTESDEAVSTGGEVSQCTSTLPSPPRSPAFLRIEKQIVAPSPMKAIRATDLTSYATLDDRLKLLKKSMGAGGAGTLSDHFAKAAMAHSVFPRSAGLSRYLDFSNSPNPLSLPTYEPIPFRALHPPKRDPEDFYYDWPADQAVKKGALTCELWRHQSGTENFDFGIQLTDEGETRGVVECTVHAQNLTKPVSKRVIVKRSIRHASMLELAITMIDKCR